MIEIVRCVNYKATKETLNKLLENLDALKDYTCKETFTDVVKYIVEDFEEEVKIDTFNDINDYIEYFLERIREIY